MSDYSARFSEVWKEINPPKEEPKAPEPGLVPKEFEEAILNYPQAPLPQWRQIGRAIRVWDNGDRDWQFDPHETHSYRDCSVGPMQTMRFKSKPTRETCYASFEQALCATMGIDVLLERICGLMRDIPPRPISDEWMTYRVRV